MDNMMNPELELNQFTNQFNSCVIATKTKVEMPYTSYAPFIKLDNDYYLIISKIAKHYENFMHEHIANLMFIEDEKTAKSIFFRKRLSFLVDIKLPIEDDQVKKEFVRVFGSTVQMLLGMDFVIVKCVVREGMMILGPGMAYEIDHNQKIKEQIRPSQGHKKS